MFFSTPGVTSNVVLVTPFFVNSLASNFWPCKAGGSFFILVGFVRELCKKVPAFRSVIRLAGTKRGDGYRVKVQIPPSTK